MSFQHNINKALLTNYGSLSILNKLLFFIGTVKTSAKRFTVARFSSSASDSNDVYTAEMVDSIEWAVESPPPLHCFEEPPILIEVKGYEDVGGH